MDKFSLYVPNFLPRKEYFDPAKNNACPGCGLALALRHVYKAAEGLIEKAVWERAPKSDFLGDTGALSFLRITKGSAHVMICFDNEAGARFPDVLTKKMPTVALAEGFAYVATACPSYPFDLYDKVKRALDTAGKSYLHILCPCPVGWVYEAEDTVKIGFKAVETNVFPLYETANGACNITVKTMKPKHPAVYFKAQQRFANLSDEDIAQAAATVEQQYGRLVEQSQPK
ncbi:MAG: hypothetical protein N3B18_08310 [Desulfobacterota bacterium]|nr:hypothetical protein [Thermodesulfobacteriota bacterium]